VRTKVEGREVTLRIAALRGSLRADASDAQRLVVWQTYWVNGTLVASDWQAKLWGAWHKLLGRGDDAAVLIFYADDDGGKGAAALAAFLQNHLNDIARWLARMRDDG
jgi:EpsI family protein